MKVWKTKKKALERQSKQVWENATTTFRTYIPRYHDMEAFIETVEDNNLKEKLYIAINSSGAFRRFKDVLLSYPEERERWFKFSFNKNRERAIDWLEARGIEATGPDNK